MFDNVLELMVLSGRSMPHAVMMMIPEPWSKHASMDPARRAFYQYHSSLMEPWDGPADIAFTDGKRIGAVLDRNGLRPGRYYVTKDDLVVMASEAGVLEFPPEHIVRKGRLQPGRMFLVDTELGRIVEDEEIKAQIINERPYAEWLKQHLVHLEGSARRAGAAAPEPVTLAKRQVSFGYTFEDQRILMAPMARDGNEGVGSMGNDTPLAALSHEVAHVVRLLQAAVRAGHESAHRLHPRRDHHVVGRVAGLGRQPARPASRRLPPRSSSRARCSPTKSSPRCGACRCPASRSARCASCSAPSAAKTASSQAIEEMRAEAQRMIEEDEVNILILSDRGVNKEFAPIPSLLAVSGLHHYLIRQGLRMKVSLALETGDAREVHHFALLIGYGCSVINPYLAFETLDGMIRDEMLPNVEHKLACKNFAKAAVKGVVKVMSKMGISAVQSYHGAQVFEAVGLRQDVIDEYFSGTASRVGGVGLDVIAREVLMRHTAAFAERKPQQPDRAAVGRPVPVARGWRVPPVQPGDRFTACRSRCARVRTPRTRATPSSSTIARRISLRCAACSTSSRASRSPIDEVESVESLMKRFKTGAMSYGSISKEAHETLAIAMNRVGGKSQHGRGWRGSGSLRARWTTATRRTPPSSRSRRAASASPATTWSTRRNCRSRWRRARSPARAASCPAPRCIRGSRRRAHTTAGVGLISPPPHHDIYSIEDLAELIHDLKNANRDARISVKLVAEVGVGTIAAGVAKAHADVVLISGADGGTGASPLTSLMHAGLPWELGLAETHQTLVINNLRSRIVVETDGQLKTGRDVAIAALLGAEEFGFATAPLVAVGCIMMRVCHLNTCPAGVATQDPRLREKFAGKPEHAVNFMRFIAQHLREIMAQLGFRKLEDMVGRVDMLEPRAAIDHWKAKGFDFSNILYAPDAGPEIGRFTQIGQDHGIDKSLDVTTLLGLCEPAIARGEKVTAEAAGAQRQPRGGHHHRQRGHEEVGRRGSARGHHPDQVQGLRGPELRRVHAERHELRARRRRQRLLRQGTVGRQARRVPVAAGHVPVRAEHDRRQRRAVRRDQAARCSCAAWRANASPCATRAWTPSSRPWAITVANT